MDSVKIALLGAAGVGKSALAVRSITGRFLHHYDPHWKMNITAR